MTKKMKYIGYAVILLIATTILLNEFIFKRQRNLDCFCSDHTQGQVPEKYIQEIFMTPKNTQSDDAMNSFVEQKSASQQSGIISPDVAVEIVEVVVERVVKKSIGPMGYDTNQPARVVLTNARYVVSFLEWPDPYRHAQTNYSIHGSVDAKTGEFLGIKHSGGGRILESDPQTKYGKTKEEEKENKVKMVRSLVELGVRVKRGEVLDHKVKKGMILKENALRAARQHVIARGRNFDSNNEPQVVLLDDVYIVVFWRYPELLIVGGETYDSRVGVDAFTGEVIAMEITRHPKSNP